MSFFSISEDVPVVDAHLGAGGLGPDDVALIVVSGELDYGASPRLRARVIAHIDSGTRHLVLDLSTVTFIDSTAIGVLVGAVARLNESGGGSLRVVCADENARVLRIFDIAGVADALDLHGSREDAFAVLARVRSVEQRAHVDPAHTGVSLETVGRRLPARATTRLYAEDAEGALDGRRGTSQPRAERRGRGVDELA
jgi:anti-sigma B factor antagonist